MTYFHPLSTQTATTTVAILRLTDAKAESATGVGGRYEREAEAVADAVGTGDHVSESTERAVERPSLKYTSFEGGSGQPLGAELRAQLEPQFGHDLSSVRVHNDVSAATAARRANARAYTAGTHLVFGAGEFAPDGSEGRRLLAHELAHVVQQRGKTTQLANGKALSYGAPSGQRKVSLTGTAANTARVVAIMNAGLAPEYRATVNGKGEVEISRTGQYGPSTSQNQAFTTRLRSLVDEAGTTAVAVASGNAIIVGSYEAAEIDVADMEALGIGLSGWDARGALLHELTEQRQRQHGATATARASGSATTGAHSEGLAAELGVVGAVLESDSNLVGATANADGTMNGSRTVVFRYPDGTRYRVAVTLDHNNVTNVIRTRLP
jgi:hypothetical protein